MQEVKTVDRESDTSVKSIRSEVLQVEKPNIAVIIPALDEEEAIQLVLAEIPDVITSVTVVDNGSRDATAERALTGGARVVYESRRGYGQACLAGLSVNQHADILVFLDADLSDYPSEMEKLIEPILENRAEFVIGIRSGKQRPLHGRVGTEICIRLINLIWKTSYRDLGPFRIIRRELLEQLAMKDQTWGWTIEMQVKAAEVGFRVQQIPIHQRDRIGRSKISGTFVGSMRAGAWMLTTIIGLWLTRNRRLKAIRMMRTQENERV